MKESDVVRVLDLETTGLDPFAPNAAILCAAWADDDGRPVVMHLADTHPDDWQTRLHNALSDCPPIIGHNVKFDAKWLRRFGVTVEVENDTMLIAQMVDENRRLGLKPLMAAEMGGDWTWGGEWDASQPNEMAKYVAKDIIATRKLYQREEPKLTDTQRTLLKRVVIPALNHLVVTELTGIYVPRTALEAAEDRLKADAEVILRQLDKVIPPESEWPKGVTPAWGATNWQRWLLFTYYGIKPAAVGKPSKMFPEGAPSMSAANLANITHPIGKLVTALAKVKKLQSGFIKPYKEQLTPRQKLYTTFNLAGTVTGRLSAGAVQNSDGKTPTVKRSSHKSVGINIQQVPKDKIIKPLFQAPPGYVFMEADYSQLELRVAAVLAQETTMLNLYAAGKDIHTWMASSLLHKSEGITPLERRTAKAINFGFLYGMRPKHFKDIAKMQYGVETTDKEAEEFRAHYFKTFPKLERWHQLQIRRAQKQGYVSTLFGRRRHLPDILSEEFGLRSAAERQSINAPVQGTGSDVALYSYARLGPRGDGWACIGMVHDALLFYVKEAQAEAHAHYVKEVMEKKLNHFNCPLVADVTWGKYWGDAAHEL